MMRVMRRSVTSKSTSKLRNQAHAPQSAAAARTLRLRATQYLYFLRAVRSKLSITLGLPYCGTSAEGRGRTRFCRLESFESASHRELHTQTVVLGQGSSTRWFSMAFFLAKWHIGIHEQEFGNDLLTLPYRAHVTKVPISPFGVMSGLSEGR